MFPEVNNKLICLAGTEEQVVVLTPGCESLDLLSVGRLIVVGYHPHHGCVICKIVYKNCVMNRVQSCVKSEYESGLRTKPWGVPWLRTVL